MGMTAKEGQARGSRGLAWPDLEVGLCLSLAKGLVTDSLPTPSWEGGQAGGWAGVGTELEA